MPKVNISVWKGVNMAEEKPTYASIDDYIAAFSPEIQEKLLALREVIKKAAPEATEKISYQMPTFAQHGNLVHFAAYKHHIGLYPGANGVAAFIEELSDYKLSKGTIQFPIDQPLPMELVTKIVQFKVDENTKKAESKSKKKKYI